MDRWKSRGGKIQRRDEKKREDQSRERARRKKIRLRQQVGKSQNTVFFQFCRSGGSKSRLAKAAGAEPSGELTNEKSHTVVARSAFRSQKRKKLTDSEHFLMFRCRFAWQAQGILHVAKGEQNVRVLWHFKVQPPLPYTALHYNPLHYTTTTATPTLHSTTLHYITLHYTPLHYTQLLYTTPTTTARTIIITTSTTTILHYTTLHFTTPHSATLHYTE